MNTINNFREILAEVRRSVTTAPGDTHPDLREAIEIFAARHAGEQRRTLECLDRTKRCGFVGGLPQ